MDDETRKVMAGRSAKLAQVRELLDMLDVDDDLAKVINDLFGYAAENMRLRSRCGRLERELEHVCAITAGLDAKRKVAEQTAGRAHAMDVLPDDVHAVVMDLNRRASRWIG